MCFSMDSLISTERAFSKGVKGGVPSAEGVFSLFIVLLVWLIPTPLAIFF